MRSRDRHWKDRVHPATATFSQVARKLESEVCALCPLLPATVQRTEHANWLLLLLGRDLLRPVHSNLFLKHLLPLPGK